MVRRNIQQSTIFFPALQSIEAVGINLYLISQGPISVNGAYTPPAAHLLPQILMTFFINCSSVVVCGALTASKSLATAVPVIQKTESSHSTQHPR
jgi:hypothetical protein